MSFSVGIDLGTTNTVVAVVRAGRAIALPDEKGRRLIPSIVSFHPSGRVLVGDAAKERRLQDPLNTVYSVKRLLGRRWSSPEVQSLRAKIPFELVEGQRESVGVRARGEVYALPEISAFVLRRASDVAKQALAEDVTSAVVTVPASFNDLQRASTKVAGQLAGLDVLRIMNEPTAAALAYGQTLSGAQRVAVYDFGGGTFDLSLLDLSRNVYEVLLTKGDTALGGDDIDGAIADKMAEHVMRTTHADIESPEVRGQLRVLAESLKIQLSDAELATVEIAGIAGPGGAELTTTFAMTRPELEALAAPHVERTLALCRAAMTAASVPLESFDAVILVGGSTRMPYVSRRVAELFRRAPFDNINPEAVVAIGASIQASILGRAHQGPNAEPAAMGTAQPLAGAASSHAPPLVLSAPARAAPDFSSAPERRPQVVAGRSPSLPGPTLQAPRSLVPTQVVGPLLIDVAPLSLGVETAGGYTDAVLAAGTPVPCDKTCLFVTAADNQTQVVVRVAQGESKRFAENTYLGECELSGLRAAPRGAVSIAVTFEMDENGLLVVKARDPQTGVETLARMRPFGAQLDPADIAAMQRRHAARRVGG